MNMTTLFLADDHPVVRQGLRVLLEAEPDFRIIGETGDGLEVSRLVELLHPDVLVLDLLMPGLGGLDIAREVQRHSPATKTVILSMYSNIAYVAESMKAGANAYIPKKSTAEELVTAIRAVMAGQIYISAMFSDETKNIEERLEKLRQQAGETLDPYDTLTRRERVVLHLVGEGLTSAQIAERLVLSPRTVDTHRRHMVRKLGLSGQAALVRYALQRGIIPLQD
jgi:DNA-binding NarL/FixJ family response regulator